MATTYEAIATVTVGSGGSSSIEFSSIPQTYTDIQLLMSLRTNIASPQDQVNMRVNFDLTAGIYAYRRLVGEGASPSTTSGSANNLEMNWAPAANQTANVFGQHSIYFADYASSSKYKSMVIQIVNEGNSSQVFGQVLQAGLYSSNTAITSIQIYCFGSIFVQYSTATLYGIKNS